MALERLRVFYAVLQVGLILLACGMLFTAAAELLWRVLPPGRTAEWVVSAISVCSWLLTSLTVSIASTCPIEELDLASFIEARPNLCFFMALPPALTAAARVSELPMPRALSLITVLGLVGRGCFGLCRRFHLPLPGAVFLLELWCLDMMVSPSVNGMARADPPRTEILLSVLALIGAAVIIALWATRSQSTIRFYVATNLACSWSGFYFAGRAFDLAMGYQQWEVGRQVDIAIVAAVAMSAATLLPLLGVSIVGRRRLFKALGDKFEHSRSRQLQSGAFMAMLLDSYFVQRGQPWWLRQHALETETVPENTFNGNTPRPFDLSASLGSKLSSIDSLCSVATPASMMPEMDMSARPDFVKGRVVQVSKDGSVFWVKPEIGEHRSVKVDRRQQVIPWPQLLELGRKNLRCMDWQSQSEELWSQNAGPGFQLSRPVAGGEVIDFFVSHSWSDNSHRKFRALHFLAEEFHVRHGRYPTFWVDKFCIDQSSVEDGLRVLPVNVMACSKVLVLCGRSYPSRLWCAWELCVLLSFMPLQAALTRLVVFPFSKSALEKLARFDLSIARCYDPNEELRLRRVISAIGQLSFENKIQALGQLILDRETSAPGLLMQGSGSWSALPESENVDVELGLPSNEASCRLTIDHLRQFEAPLEEVSF